MTPAAALAIVAAVAVTPPDDGGHSTVAPAVASPESRPEPSYGRTAPDIVVPAAHGLALMTVMRVTESVIWPDPFSRPEQFGARYEEAFTKPPKHDTRGRFMQWDGDPLVVNTVGHALFGSEIYLRARQCRFGWAGSLAFAAATSAVWEYGFEANGARPSAQDLVFTPLAGLVLGEARFLLHRAARRLRGATRVVVRGALDPFGEIERAAGTDC
ncbi:MAG: DUF3943 domain-containing protein [Myxococcales bacterium]|nr:DUF3943 domain-containing protein [Myxococcales bacterium]